MFSWPSGQNHEHHKCLACPWQDPGGARIKGKPCREFVSRTVARRRLETIELLENGNFFHFLWHKHIRTSWLLFLRCLHFLCTDISALPLNRVCCRVWGCPGSCQRTSCLHTSWSSRVILKTNSSFCIML